MWSYQSSEYVRSASSFTCSVLIPCSASASSPRASLQFFSPLPLSLFLSSYAITSLVDHVRNPRGRRRDRPKPQHRRVPSGKAEKSDSSRGSLFAVPLIPNPPDWWRSGTPAQIFLIEYLPVKTQVIIIIIIIIIYLLKTKNNNSMKCTK